jgi:protein TonB
MDIGGKTNINPVPGMTITNDPVKPGEGTEPVKSKAPATDRTRPVYFAEVMPEFPGGNAALRDFLQKNLRSPQDLESGEEVEVRVSFVVGYDGKLQSFVTLQDGGEAFNNEVIRVLRKMPDWKPGRANGENVSVYFTLPVKFVPAE